MSQGRPSDIELSWRSNVVGGKRRKKDEPITAGIGRETPGGAMRRPHATLEPAMRCGGEKEEKEGSRKIRRAQRKQFRRLSLQTPVRKKRKKGEGKRRRLWVVGGNAHDPQLTILLTRLR